MLELYVAFRDYGFMMTLVEDMVMQSARRSSSLPS
jgi:lysyl-tRNA synthetase class II